MPALPTPCEDCGADSYRYSKRCWDCEVRAREERRTRKLEPRARLRKQAYDAVKDALARGDLVRPEACERCGAVVPLDGHHADHSQPLEVEWLCRPCHAAHHVAERQAA